MVILEGQRRAIPCRGPKTEMAWGAPSVELSDLEFCLDQGPWHTPHSIWFGSWAVM